MTVFDATMLFLIMGCLAAVPSSSVALVVVRSATLNVRNGIAASLGIVTGDLIFTLMAILGLSALAETLGAFFTLIRYVAAGYLIGFGISLLRSLNHSEPHRTVSPGGGMVASFSAGLALTLSDIKAILFYASLFPAFVNIPTLSRLDLGLIVVVTVFAVGGVKIIYAISARKIMTFSRSAHSTAKPLAGMAMIATGGYLLTKN